MAKMQTDPEPKCLYVHLCCEGWTRLGPFEWIAFDETRQALVDETGSIVTQQTALGWTVPGNDYQGTTFCRWLLTAGPNHPSSNRGDLVFNTQGVNDHVKDRT